MNSLSVVINVVQEELADLERALKSVKNIADEIVIVDMTDTGIPVKLIRDYKLTIAKHKRTSHVEPARNFGVGKARNPWILILDPDEEASAGLRDKILEITKSQEAGDYYRVPRKNMIFGKWIEHSMWWPDYNIRFFKKGYVVWDPQIHKVPITTGKGRDMEAQEELAINHYHYQTIEQYVTRMNRYTTVQADSIFSNSLEYKWQDIITKPSQEFFRRYFALEGYKDGLHGIALASLQAASELLVYLKVWQLHKFEQKNVNVEKTLELMNQNRKDFAYWSADVLIKTKGGVVPRLRRKFKI